MSERKIKSEIPPTPLLQGGNKTAPPLEPLAPLSKGVGAQRRGDFQGYGEHLKPYARALRAEATDAERLLWSRLRRKQLGVLFHCQKPLANYIVDFYCSSANLVVEVDGGQHFQDQGLQDDHERDAALAKLGITVLRFDNLQVLKELDAVLASIHQFISRIETAEPMHE